MQNNVIATIFALTLGAATAAHAASFMPEASHQVAQPSRHVNLDRSYVFHQTMPDLKDGGVVTPQQTPVPRVPRAPTANDTNWLAGGGG